MRIGIYTVIQNSSVQQDHNEGHNGLSLHVHESRFQSKQWKQLNEGEKKEGTDERYNISQTSLLKLLPHNQIPQFRL